MSDNNQNPSRSKPQLPEPTPTNGGPAKVPFDESLLYITGTRKEGLQRFRQFLFEDKGWSREQVDFFLAAMADRWPPIEYPLKLSMLPPLMPTMMSWEPSPFVKSVLAHPAKNTIVQAYGLGRSDLWHRSEQLYNYGGFLQAELPTLRATYSAWWKRQRARTDNLPRKKKNIQKVEKIPLTG